MPSRRNLVLAALGTLLVFFKYKSIRKFVQQLLFKRETLRAIPWLESSTHGGLIAAHVLKVKKGKRKEKKKAARSPSCRSTASRSSSR